MTSKTFLFSGPKRIDARVQTKRVPRPTNAFLLFANDQRTKIMKEFPYMGPREISIK